MKIANLPSDTISACKKIHEVDLAFNELLAGASAGPSRHELVEDLVRNPTADKLADIVHFDQASATLASLQHDVISSRLSPARIYGEQLRTVLSGPLQDAIADLRSELKKLNLQESKSCEAHGLEYQPGGNARSLAERIGIAEDSLRQLIAGTASPLKMLGRLGYSIDGKVDAEALSQSAINAARAGAKAAAMVERTAF